MPVKVQSALSLCAVQNEAVLSQPLSSLPNKTRMHYPSEVLLCDPAKGQSVWFLKEIFFLKLTIEKNIFYFYLIFLQTNQKNAD